MAKFTKKPVTIEAWDAHQLMISARSNWDDLPQAIRDAYEKGDVLFHSEYILIKTLEGNHRADPSDKVIQGVKGELYPCKPDIFAMTYDAALLTELELAESKFAVCREETIKECAYAVSFACGAKEKLLSKLPTSTNEITVTHKISNANERVLPSVAEKKS